MTFDLAQYQSDRIRALTRQVAGLEYVRDMLVRVLAGVIVDYEARRVIDALSQDEFMHELSLEFESRPPGSSREVGSQSKRPGGRSTSLLDSQVASNHNGRTT